MASHKSLVSQHLEGIPGTALDKYQRIIREYVGKRHGIYALSRRDRLYYVGLASHLRSRLNHHLRDRHRGEWDTLPLSYRHAQQRLRNGQSLQGQPGFGGNTPASTAWGFPAREQDDPIPRALTREHRHAEDA